MSAIEGIDKQSAQNDLHRYKIPDASKTYNANKDGRVAYSYKSDAKETTFDDIKTESQKTETNNEGFEFNINKFEGENRKVYKSIQTSHKNFLYNRKGWPADFDETTRDIVIDFGGRPVGKKDLF